MLTSLVCRSPLLRHGIAASLLAIALTGCGEDDADGSVRSHARVAHASGPQYDVGVSGYGGRSTAQRSISDPLHYAYYGLPQYAALLPQPLILFNTGYAVGYDTKRQLPLWVCYRLNDADQGASHGTSNREHASAQVDPRLGPHQQMPDPKSRDGLHGLPLANPEAILASYGQAAGEECDYTSDLLPSAAPPGWSQLHALEPHYARSNHELWVITGPLLKDATTSEITGLWKIQIVVQMGHTVTQAFILPLAASTQRSSDGTIDLSSSLTTIHAISLQTHLTLMPQLPDIDDQTVGEVLDLPAPSVWPSGTEVASSAAASTGRR